MSQGLTLGLAAGAANGANLRFLPFSCSQNEVVDYNVGSNLALDFTLKNKFSHKYEEDEEVTPEETHLIEADEDDDYEEDSDDLEKNTLLLEVAADNNKNHNNNNNESHIKNSSALEHPDSPVSAMDKLDQYYGMDMDEEVIGSDGGRRIRCKKCDARFITKELLWQHSRMVHMNPLRVLQCKYCTFVTELRHHYDFHMKSHTGEKPFQCDLCDYRCKNRGMLTSHRKSHQEGYDFFCADCNFRAKFKSNMHSHVRRTHHRQLQWPSSANSNSLLAKQQLSCSINSQPNNGLADCAKFSNSTSPVDCTSQSSTAVLTNLATTFTYANDNAALRHISSANQLSNSIMNGIVASGGAFSTMPPSHELLMMHVDALTKSSMTKPTPSSIQVPVCSSAAAFSAAAEMTFLMSRLQNAVPPQHSTHPLAALHPWSLLPPSMAADFHMNMTLQAPPPPLRMRSAMPRTDSMSPHEESCSSETMTGKHTDTEQEAVATSENSQLQSRQVGCLTTTATASPSSINENSTNTQPKVGNECQYCCMFFKDEAMFDLHRGYHTHDNPFKCNRCGHQSDNKLDFTLHLYKNEHK